MTKPILHLPLMRDFENRSGIALEVKAGGIRFPECESPLGASSAAFFDGKASWIAVSPHPSLGPGRGEFTFSAWVCTEDGWPGTLFSRFDPKEGRGAHLSICTNYGVTSTANNRNLHFGMDAGRDDPDWQDCGHPGNAVKIASLGVIHGHLYAGTVETGPHEKGRLFRYGGGMRWVEIDTPESCNSISSIAEHEESLVIGTGRYLMHGSALGETQNRIPGGHVYRREKDGTWTALGQPGQKGAVPEDDGPLTDYSSGKADDVSCLLSWKGDLYAISNHRTGIFRHREGIGWEAIVPDRRNISLCIFQGDLYALPNGALPVLRYLGGKKWEDCGAPARVTQTYCGTVFENRLYIATWPEGEVHVYEGNRTWSRVGQAGFEREIMAMAVYNGRPYLGSLPMGNVYRMEPDGFRLMGNLDASPVTLRRVWTLAVHEGKLYGGTLPSGRLRCFEAGKMATWDRSFPDGWHHVTATKDRERLRLYVDGSLVAMSSVFHPEEYDLTNGMPLRIGSGEYGTFRGMMAHVRMYDRSLNETEIRELGNTAS